MCPSCTAAYIIFQSTPSVGRATGMGGALEFIDEISIHALRGEGDKMVQQAFDYLDISIHALRGEGDESAAPRAL